MKKLKILSFGLLLFLLSCSENRSTFETSPQIHEIDPGSSNHSHSTEWEEESSDFKFNVDVGEFIDFSPTSCSIPFILGSSEEVVKTPDPEELMGRILYNPSTEMLQGKTEFVTIRISNDFFTNIEEDLFGRGEVKTENIHIGPVMTVDLLGLGFDIERMNGERTQRVTSSTEWVFWVTPIKSGDRILSLNVYIAVPMGEFGVVSQTERVFRKDISVKVSPWFWFSKHWEFVLGTLFGSGILTSVFVYVFKKMVKRKC